MIETMTFLRQDGRTVLVGDWPQEVEFSRELLDQSWPLLVTEDGYVECSVYNGCAFYEITGRRGIRYDVESVGEVVCARLVNGFVGFDP